MTTRVHHLAWYTMAGEAKRDYPASIGYQSPWYHAYHLVEDYFSRLNTVLTRGQRRVRVGVIHPIESYWLCCGPLSQTADQREERERAFAEVTEWLLFGQIDFDFVAESLLPRLSGGTSMTQLVVGKAAYDVIVVPSLHTLRATTLDRLEQLREAGGSILFAGEVPSLVDALPSVRAQELARRSISVPWSRRQLLAHLDAFRDVTIEHPDGANRSILHQLRCDGAKRFLFLANTDASNARPGTLITIRGEWSAKVLDAMRGEDYAVRTYLSDDATQLTWNFPAHGSLLLALEPGRTPIDITSQRPQQTELCRLAHPISVTLNEPNVVVLNQARYRLTDEPWQPVEEVLRIDSALRQRLGLPLRGEEAVQPWTVQESAMAHDQLQLAFDVILDVAVDESYLALENAASTLITVDGQRVNSEVVGWFVDEAIQKVPMPPLAPGVHEIMLQLPFGTRADPEWCYLLGHFGVELHGRHIRVVAPPRSLAFRDWTRQLLPFYAGNVTYHCGFTTDHTRMVLQVSRFAAPLLEIRLDGCDIGPIAFAPFELDLGEVSAGQHSLDITVYGNRINAFGALHNADNRTAWFGPEMWRTSGDAWAYEY